MHMQVEAIRAGTQPGLTMVVGPPGTGKTDTAVQIMHVLYHNCPSQRTLLIAHSNQVCLKLVLLRLMSNVPAMFCPVCAQCVPAVAGGLSCEEGPWQGVSLSIAFISSAVHQVGAPGH